MGRPLSLPSALKIREIERLRALAVFAVIFYHLRVNFPVVFPEHFGSPRGVDLFFVISGYVVSKSLLALYESNKNRAATIKGFFLKRSFRILPLAFTLVAYFLFVYYVIGFRTGRFAAVPESVWAILTLRFNYELAANPDLGSLGFFWTLMVEEHFYLFIPFLLLALNSNKKRLVGCLVGLGVVRLLLVPYTSYFGSGDYLVRLIAFGSHSRFAELFLGVLIYFVGVTVPNFRANLIKIPKLILVLISSAAVVVLVLFPFIEATALGQYQGILIVIVCGTLVTLAALNANFVMNIRGLNRPMEYLGSRSYGLYLWHVAVINSLEIIKFWPNTVAEVFLTVIPATILVAEIGYRFIERPAIQLSYKLTGRETYAGHRL